MHFFNLVLAEKTMVPDHNGPRRGRSERILLNNCEIVRAPALKKKDYLIKWKERQKCLSHPPTTAFLAKRQENTSCTSASLDG
jgi:hypothetical protein